VTNVLIAVVLGALALGAAWVINRRKPRTSAVVDHHVPTHVDRVDFARPDAPVLVAVFTSATCATCAAMLSTAHHAASAAVVVDEAEAAARADLHERYRIDAVPIAVVVDRDGVVRASFAGSMSAGDLSAAIDQVSTR
jgi:thioredoxin-like negative regulator of GroEL